MESSADVSTLAASPISTFVRHYVPCTQVDIGLAARVDTRPRTPSSVGFVYVLHFSLNTLIKRLIDKKTIDLFIFLSI